MSLDHPKAIEWLGMIGYYRLSGYWYPYRLLVDGARTDRFLDATALERVVQLYDFDRTLKLLMLEALERIEIGMRCRVGYTLGLRGPYAHLDPANFDRKFTKATPLTPAMKATNPSRYDTWLTKVEAAQRQSHEDFVTHFRTKYDGRLPTWVVTELLDFGGLSVLYQGLAARDRNQIAAELGVTDAKGGNGSGLANWMHLMAYVRNVCAHHSRFWNQNMARQVAPRSGRPINSLRHIGELTESALARPYPAICMVTYLVRQIDPGATWVSRLVELVQSSLLPSGRRAAEMGMPGDWAKRLQSI